MTTTRLTLEQRRAAEAYAGRMCARYAPITPPEPALGTLQQRLTILVMRHGGRVKAPTRRRWRTRW